MPLTYENISPVDLVAAIRAQKDVSIFLGNGCSIAAHKDFGEVYKRQNNATYDALTKEFNDSNIENLLFFLEITKRSLQALSQNKELALSQSAENLHRETVKLKNQFISSLLDSHPARPDVLPDYKYKNCGNFLSLFKQIFTTNYDLLLYWTAQSHGAMKKKFHDGFAVDTNNYLYWQENTQQNVFYLHGCFHVFSKPYENKFVKLEAARNHLIEEVRNTLKGCQEQFLPTHANDQSNRPYSPVVIVEGPYRHKDMSIRRNHFLDYARQQLENAQGAMMFYGYGCTKSDQHILSYIMQSAVHTFYFGYYDKPTYRRMRRWAEKITDRFPERKVYLFNTNHFNIWDMDMTAPYCPLPKA